MVSISILMTIALLSQGQIHSIFNEGIALYSSIVNENDDDDVDAAEAAIFPPHEDMKNSSSLAEEGGRVFMNSCAPLLTASLGTLVFFSSYYIASQSVWTKSILPSLW